MAAFDARAWQRLSPYLDQLLALDHVERAGALADVRAQDEPLAAELQALLERHDAAVASGFLAQDLHAEVDRMSPVSRGQLTPGTKLAGRYRVVSFIARGGMGDVYEAHDLELGTRVALKTIRTDRGGDERSRARFRREIQLARAITHPNVCRIFDLGLHDGGAAPSMFLTMELLRGETLADRLARDGPLSPAEADKVVPPMLSALAAAHAAGVVHRDFKSSNVVLAAEEGGTRVVVTDFGIAKSLRPHHPGEGQSTEQILGTPAYMAPEQLQGGPITPAVDIYAFGVVLFELLTGHHPFATAPGGQTVNARLPVRLEARWGHIVERCLRQAPAERYASVSELISALGKPRLGRRRAVYLIPIVGLALGSAAVLLAPTAGTSPGIFSGRAERSQVRVEVTNRSSSSSASPVADALRKLLAAELARQASLQVTVGGTGPAAGVDFLVSGSSFVIDGNNRSDVLLVVEVEDRRAGRVIETVQAQGPQSDLPALVGRVAGAVRQSLTPSSGALVMDAGTERLDGPATSSDVFASSGLEDLQPRRVRSRARPKGAATSITPSGGTPHDASAPSGNDAQDGAARTSAPASSPRWLPPERW